MKKATAFLFFLLFIIANTVIAQKKSSKQTAVAQKFLDNMLKGEAETCWQLLDTSMKSQLTKQQFYRVVAQSKKELSFIKHFVFDTMEVKIKDGKHMSQYLFRINPTLQDTSSKKMYMIVSFLKSSLLVADLSNVTRETVNQAPAGFDATLETVQENFSINVDSSHFTVLSFGFVHFGIGNGFIEVKVEHAQTSTMKDKKEMVKSIAIQILKQLQLDGKIDKANARAKEMNKTLDPIFQVLFVDQASGSFHPVFLNKNEL